MKKANEKTIMSITKYMRLDEINPYIRRASKHLIQAGLDTGNRINVHYQLHYVIKGKGQFVINKELFHVSEGDFFIWCPGEIHSIYSDEKHPLQVIGVQFDFTRNFCDSNYPCIHFNETSFSWDKVNEVVQIKEIHNITNCTKVLEQKMVQSYLEDVVGLYEENSAYAQHIMSGILKAILITILEEFTRGDEKFKIKKDVIREVMAYLNNHYSEKLSNALLGARFGYHPNHLNHMFLVHTGYTIQQYIINMRMSKAIDLLLHTNETISQIGILVGGYSIHYFSRLFKEKIGVSPSAFRDGAE